LQLKALKLELNEQKRGNPKNGKYCYLEWIILDLRRHRAADHQARLCIIGGAAQHNRGPVPGLFVSSLRIEADLHYVPSHPQKTIRGCRRCSATPGNEQARMSRPLCRMRLTLVSGCMPLLDTPRQFLPGDLGAALTSPQFFGGLTILSTVSTFWTATGICSISTTVICLESGHQPGWLRFLAQSSPRTPRPRHQVPRSTFLFKPSKVRRGGLPVTYARTPLIRHNK
jgi:hypothetical protein